jgi:predicted DNA-binding transcriptional regulator AlpA
MHTQNKTSESGGIISRESLATRWECSQETLKRMEKRGQLSRVMLGERMVRYRMSEVLRIEGQQLRTRAGA